MIVRGLEPWKYKRLENSIVFAGISSYIGNRRGLQSKDGPVMSEYSPSALSALNTSILGINNRELTSVMQRTFSTTPQRLMSKRSSTTAT